MTNNLKIYTLLSNLFVVLFVVSNLVFKKFVAVWLLGYKIEVSVGLFFYPVIFVISDLVTEFYGRSHAKIMIYYSTLCSLIVLILIQISNIVPAAYWSLVDDKIFSLVFGSYKEAVLISIFVGLIAQMLDVYCFSYIKQKTNGRYMWFRNSVSTILGQLVDSILVVLLLSLAGIIDEVPTSNIILSSMFFKLVVTICSVGLYYLAYHLISSFLCKQKTNGLNSRNL
ncbi:MAG TPA: queuosine precursor transporter [Candidatus Megaira endosymbiont of Nemacystus decipiens]|nr:queuosine precursor transporter [Candidatus Megaera endosymbiont of Nemacystus decipiens]